MSQRRRRRKQSYKNTRYVSFGGTDEYVDFSDVLDLESTTARSYSFVFKTSSANTMAFMSKSMASGDGYNGYQIYVSNGKVYFRIYDNGTGSGIKANTDNTFHDGASHHAIITYDGSQTEAGIKFYIDNTLEAQTNAGNTGFTVSTINTADLNYGRASYGSSYYTGDLDEVNQYTGVLTSGERGIIYGEDQSGAFDPGKIGDAKRISTNIHNIGCGENANYSGGNWTFGDRASNNYDGVSANMEGADVKEY